MWSALTIAGFDGFASNQDIGYVFEIEREVGSFYAGWDEEILDDIEGHLQDTLSEAHPSPQPEITDLSPAPDPTPPNVDEPRSRATSMPPNQPSPTSFPTGPRARPRRNSSIHEPSPLARLFVRSPERPLRRIAHSLLPGSSSQPSLVDILSRTVHARADSIPMPRSGRPSVPPIQEGRQAEPTDQSEAEQGGETESRRSKGVRFPSMQDTWSYPQSKTGRGHSGEVSTIDSKRGVSFSDLGDLGKDKEGSLSPSGDRRREVSEGHQHQRERSSESIGKQRLERVMSPTGREREGIAKASAIEEGIDPPETPWRASRLVDEDLRKRLEGMEARQERIEGLLERLVQASK